MVSHLTWVRGLKQLISPISANALQVAPYVGAWIETFMVSASDSIKMVAPYVGAWIETCNSRYRKRYEKKSHLTWVRGLKPSSYL